MKLITRELMQQMSKKAQESVRRRSHHTVHTDPADPVQRMFVTVKRDSYIRPHRHPVRWEFAVMLQGSFDVLFFDDAATLTQRIAVGDGHDVLAFEIPANTWHTWLSTSDEATFLEIKQGPYDPVTAAEFASWSPPEGDHQTAAFMEKLMSLRVGERLV